MCAQLSTSATEIYWDSDFKTVTANDREETTHKEITKVETEVIDLNAINLEVDKKMFEIKKL